MNANTTTVGPFNPAAALVRAAAASAASDAAELALARFDAPGAGQLAPLADDDAMLLSDLRAAVQDAYAAERAAIANHESEVAGLNAAYGRAI